MKTRGQKIETGGWRARSVSAGGDLKLFPPGAPWLSIFRTTTNTVAVFWPSPSTGYGLEQTPSLSGSSWNGVTNTPSDNGTIKSVTLPMQPGNKFFRLKKP